MTGKYYIHIGTLAEKVTSAILGYADHPECHSCRKYSCSATAGLTELDGIMGGFHRGNLYIIAGRPGMGKSSFALNVALTSLRASKPVYYFSPSLSPEEIVTRMISIMTGVETFSFRLKNMSDREKSAVKCAADELKTMPFYICYHPFPEAKELASMIRNSDRDGIAVIDDIQSVCHNKSRPFTPSLMDMDSISKVSRELKLAAVDAGIPLICTSRLPRDPETRDNKRPILSDLESTAGVMADDADGVIFLYRDSYYHDTADKSNSELILAKNRWGSVGVANATFNCLSGRFGNIEN